MRIAVIADIHGNDLALEAVLADIDRRGIREIVNLGDHLSGALNAGRTADILLSRTDIACIAGNHDRWLLEKQPDAMGSWDRRAHAQLAAHHLNWLAQLPPTRLVADTVFLCHGTPGTASSGSTAMSHQRPAQSPIKTSSDRKMPSQSTRRSRASSSCRTAFMNWPITPPL